MAATAIGVIIGPAAAGIVDPQDAFAGKALYTVVEQFSRIILAIQSISIALSLPTLYYERNWFSVLMLVGPVMLLTWAVSFGFTAAVFAGQFGLLQCLLIAATLIPTDPVLASTIVDGRFAETYLPAELRNVLQAEAAVNDGLSYPYFAIVMLLLKPRLSTGSAFGHWFYEAWAYEILLGIVMGACYGGFCRLLHTWGRRYKLEEQDSFLAHVIGMALGVLGLVTLVGAEGILAATVAGIAYTAREPQREREKYEAKSGIELIIVISYFVFFGAILPYPQWVEIGIGKLILFSLAVIFLRRTPVVLLLSPWIPAFARHNDLRATLTEAAFGGFYGPIGVGALFYAAGAYSELGEDRVFAVVSFVVLTSVIVHGLSAAPLCLTVHYALKHWNEEPVQSTGGGVTVPRTRHWLKYGQFWAHLFHRNLKYDHEPDSEPPIARHSMDDGDQA
ncbi:sodium hydrogen exchanger [Klebsormidium nitens]|uniref:Sodium hydrogen exchanger n=1 Tax=Klebsormidium nitens TaxID=105231 RepID=A0A1Y1I6I7_KLENI|nr:sodium hydrogen exchanger [Klebsormidium nitens]|eukprot:GAQ83708.1 sodium hydrogen exchanger [Klebsormidium nitens]